MAEALTSDLVEPESTCASTPRSRPIFFLGFLIGMVSGTRYVTSDISRDKELGCGSDGRRRCAGRRDPEKQKTKKKNYASSSHRSVPVPPSQAASLLRPHDSHAPGRVKSLLLLTWGDSWCPVRESSSSSLSKPRTQYTRKWLNVRPRLCRAEPTAFALATGRWPRNAFISPS